MSKACSKACSKARRPASAAAKNTGALQDELVTVNREQLRDAQDELRDQQDQRQCQVAHPVGRKGIQVAKGRGL